MKLRFAIALFILAVSLHAQAQQWGNFTLYATQNGTTATLLDSNHNAAHTWTFSSTAKTGYSTYMIPGGTLVRTVARSGNSFTGGPICGEVQKVDWNGTLLWDFVYSTTNYCSHHDLCPMPNGNVLLISYERKSATEVANAGCSTFASEMWPDKIVEVQPTGATTGTIVWEWHAWDHLVQNTNASAANYQSSIVNHPELLNINYQAAKDWMHMNGVAYNPILDQVVFSSHALNEVYVIDHSTTTTEAASHNGGNSGHGGDILYRWGNPAAYQASGTQIFKVVHDAHWNPEGVPNAGYIGGYNNQGISTSASCADMFNPPVNGYNYSLTLGQQYQPTTYAIRQAAGGYNPDMGNYQQLPNGNILMNLGTAGFIKEYNSAGTLLWSKTLTGANAKAFKFDSCYTFNVAPTIPIISLNGADLVSTSGVTYQWYLNGQLIVGAMSQNYTPTANGIYVVRITDSNGCLYQYSAGYHYSATTGLKQLEDDNAVTIYPNPSTGVFTLDHGGIKEDYMVSVFNAVGKLICEYSNISSLDLSAFGNGVYYATIRTEAGVLNKKISVIK